MSSTTEIPDFAAIAAELAAKSPTEPPPPDESPSQMEVFAGAYREALPKGRRATAAESRRACAQARARLELHQREGGRRPVREGQRAAVLRALERHGPCTSAELTRLAELPDRYIAARRLPELLRLGHASRRRRGSEWVWEVTT